MSKPTLPTSDIVHDLAKDGFSIQRDFFPREWGDAARNEILSETNAFKRAGIGKLSLNHVSDTIRKDLTCWWEMDLPTAAQKPFVEYLSRLKDSINRGLFLGLWDFEGHYAIYEEGAFYKKHVDRFKNDSKRTVSIVAFFNEAWNTKDGGLLVLEKDSKRVEIMPESGTLVAFLSDSVPHEVTKAERQRLSFAGWYRTR